MVERFCYLLWLRHYKQILVGVGAFQRGWVTLSAYFKWKGTSSPNHYWRQKTRVFLLPHSEDPLILSSFVWIGYQRVTDRRNCYRYYSTLHCKQCGRTVKKLHIVSLDQLINCRLCCERPKHCDYVLCVLVLMLYVQSSIWAAICKNIYLFIYLYDTHTHQ